LDVCASLPALTRAARSQHIEEPSMEGLFRIVDESFARHGIEPVSDVRPASIARFLPELPALEDFPDHNFRQAADFEPVR
jgi:hypothetical protein